MFIMLVEHLALPRCPHCRVAHPTLQARSVAEAKGIVNQQSRWWKTYTCRSCGGGIVAASFKENGPVIEVYPDVGTVDDAVPDPARSYLQQAQDSLHSPAGAVMLAASAVTAMLKARGFERQTLNASIDAATEAHLITEDMRLWAHDVRLDANEPRHADVDRPLPSPADASRCVDFATALAEILFVLPLRVKRGMQKEQGAG